LNYGQEYQLIISYQKSLLKNIPIKLIGGGFAQIKNYLNNLSKKYSDKLNWIRISFCQVLSERFILKHSDKVSWGTIGIKQELSEKFIEEYSDKLN
jgi:hypothetical protein